MSDETNKSVTESEPEVVQAVEAGGRKDPIREKLLEYSIDDPIVIDLIKTNLGVETIDDLAVLEVSDLTGVGVKLVPARKLLSDIKAAAKPVASPAVAEAETRVIGQFDALLPSVPSDESWLNALKTGGVLKVDESSYIAAIRVAFADLAGLYSIPDKICKAMEVYADETEEQVDPTFYKLRKMLTRRDYGDIFAAIDGLDGSFITESRSREFLKRFRSKFWPAVVESYQTLNGWYQSWRASFTDPSMLIAAISGGFNGGAAGISMITPPDTAPLHDAGDALIDSINRVFRGTGVQVVAAMAYSANAIRNTLEDPRLPAMVGVKNREMMLKKIGVGVSSNYTRLEQNLVKYVLSFVKHNTVTSDVEVNYFVALWQLGTQINWDELGGDSDGSAGSVWKNLP